MNIEALLIALWMCVLLPLSQHPVRTSLYLYLQQPIYQIAFAIVLQLVPIVDALVHIFSPLFASSSLPLSAHSSSCHYAAKFPLYSQLEFVQLGPPISHLPVLLLQDPGTRTPVPFSLRDSSQQTHSAHPCSST